MTATPDSYIAASENFDLGYDQGVSEVLDEVRGRDPEMHEAIAREFPMWRRK